ncbi:cache domain-containing protein, partial [Methylobacterium trifolii]
MARFNLSIAQRFVGIAVVAVLLAAGSIGLALVHTRAMMFEQKRIQVRAIVESAATAIRPFIERARAGEMTEAEAKARAAATLASIRYDGTNYVFAYRFDGHTLAHVRKDFIGTNRWDNFDKLNALYITREIVKAGRAGQGYIEYATPKPNETEPMPKISFVLGIPEWDWAVGSGVYVDNVDVELRDTILTLAKETGPLALLCIGLVLLIARSVLGPLKALTGSMRKLASGDVEAPVAGEGRGDEIGAIAGAVVALFLTIAMLGTAGWTRP